MVRLRAHAESKVTLRVLLEIHAVCTEQRLTLLPQQDVDVALEDDLEITRVETHEARVYLHVQGDPLALGEMHDDREVRQSSDDLSPIRAIER